MAEQPGEVGEAVERALRLDARDTGDVVEARCIAVARRANASRIIATADRSPLTAASAARWATFDTFEVVWLWKLVAALTTSAGPISQPTRQPVIAYVLATPFRIRHCSASSGTTAGIDTKRWSPYVRCS